MLDLIMYSTRTKKSSVVHLSDSADGKTIWACHPVYTVRLETSATKGLVETLSGPATRTLAQSIY